MSQNPEIPKSRIPINGVLLVFILLMLLLWWWSLDFPFFWDNVLLSSLFADWFYDNGMNAFILGSEIDCGHPPFFGWYLAAWWNALGKTLWVSHLAMLPFLVGIGSFLFFILKYFVRESEKFISLLLLLEPTFLAQCTMVSNDVVQLFGFLMAWCAILYRKWIWVIPATLVMTVVSIRGAVMVFALFVGGLILDKTRDKEWAWRRIAYFVPAGLLFVLWNGYHWKETGALLVGNNPAWAEHYQAVTIDVLVKHLIVFVKVFLDFGRLFVWLGLLVFMVKTKGRFTQKQKEIVYPAAGMLVVFALVLFSNTNPIGHRYLLPFYFFPLLLLLTYFEHPWTRLKKGIFALVGIGLLTGHLWVYPPTMAQGWDSSLAHVPYFELKAEAMGFIEKEGIDPTEVAAPFFMYRPAEITNLSNEFPALTRFESPISNQKYILFTNVSNDFSDDDIALLEKEWEVVFYKKKMGVFVVLYSSE